MFGERAQKYAMWLVMLAMALFLPVMGLLGEGRNLANDPNGYDIGHFGMGISFMILVVTAMIAPATADFNIKVMPIWTAVLVIYGLIGMMATILLSINSDRTSAVSFFYIPVVIFCLNLVLTFLIQTWAASEGLGLSLWKVLSAHGLFAAWTFLALMHIASTTFFVVSAVVIMATLLTAIPIAIVAERRRQAAVEPRKPSA